MDRLFGYTSYTSDDDWFVRFGDNRHLYDDDDDDNGYGSYGGVSNNRRWKEQEIMFYRPDGTTESKSIGWCLDNGFEEMADGLWSGPWYHSNRKKRPRDEHDALQKDEYNEDTERQAESDEKRSSMEKKGEEGYMDHLERRRYLERKDESDHRVPKKRKKKRKAANLGLFKCPVECGRNRFRNQKELDRHLREQTGKGHDRYRLEHDIPKCLGVRSKKMDKPFRWKPGRAKRETKPPPCEPSSSLAHGQKQTDIRLSFVSSSAPPNNKKAQADIRRFFPPKYVAS